MSSKGKLFRCTKCYKTFICDHDVTAKIDDKTVCNDCATEQYNLLPIGVIPEFIWVEQRVQDLNDAILRYLNVNKTIPCEWYEERNKHIKWLQDRR
jgi:NAD-dependent SIR2 family protein deacetylase